MAERLGRKEARAIVDGMLDEAERLGLRRFAVAVVDVGSHMVHFARTDGAVPLNVRMAYNKAYTASHWQMDTKDVRERLFSMSLGIERKDTAWFGEPLLTPILGGVVLRSKSGDVVGAIGESGGSEQQDEDIARLGAEIFAKI